MLLFECRVGIVLENKRGCLIVVHYTESSGWASGNPGPDIISVSHLNSLHGIIVDILIWIERNNLIHIKFADYPPSKKINPIHRFTSADLRNQWTFPCPYSKYWQILTFKCFFDPTPSTRRKEILVQLIIRLLVMLSKSLALKVKCV